MVDFFSCPNVTASSAPIESDFNNLKNRILKNESKPIEVDKSDIFIYYIIKIKNYKIIKCKEIVNITN